MATKQSTAGGVLTEDEALEIISYLVASAETSLSEPSHYAIFRLIDASSRMIGLMLDHETPRTGEFLRRFKAEVDQKKVWMMWDSEAFFDFVRTAPAGVAAEAKRLAAVDDLEAKEANA
jgi:hypothetical protein